MASSVGCLLVPATPGDDRLGKARAGLGPVRAVGRPRTPKAGSRCQGPGGCGRGPRQVMGKTACAAGPITPGPGATGAATASVPTIRGCTRTTSPRGPGGAAPWGPISGGRIATRCGGCRSGPVAAGPLPPVGAPPIDVPSLGASPTTSSLAARCTAPGAPACGRGMALRRGRGGAHGADARPQVAAPSAARKIVRPVSRRPLCTAAPRRARARGRVAGPAT